MIWRIEFAIIILAVSISVLGVSHIVNTMNDVKVVKSQQEQIMNVLKSQLFSGVINTEIQCKNSREIRMLEIETGIAWYNEMKVAEWHEDCMNNVWDYKELYDNHVEIMKELGYDVNVVDKQ